MIVQDITLEADGARRLDTTSALRSFVTPISLVFGLTAIGLAIWFVFAGDELISPSLWPVALFASVGVVFFSPMLTLFMDHLARSPLRRMSAFLAILLGGLFHVSIAIIAVGIFLFMILLVAVSEVRDEIIRSVANMIEYREAPSALVSLVQLILGGLGLWFLWRTYKTESLLATPIKRSLLIGDVSKTGIWQRLAYLLGVPSSMWHAGALLLPSFYLFIIARLLVYAAYWIATQLPPLFEMSAFDSRLVWVPIGVFIIIIAIAHGTFILAKRLAARRIWARGKDDEKPPILFLRSFEDDQFSFRQSFRDPVSWWFNLWSFRRNADEMMIDEFAHYGPVVALGQPGEKSTPFGAQRQYASHDDWQHTIKQAAREAKAIVVAAGSTPGLSWEYELLKSENYLDKTVFLFPPPNRDPEDFKAAVDLYEAAFGPLPQYDEDKVLLGVWLQSGGSRAWVADSPHAQAYLVLLREFMQTRFKAIQPSISPVGLWVGALSAISAIILLSVLAASNAVATNPVTGTTTLVIPPGDTVVFGSLQSDFRRAAAVSDDPDQQVRADRLVRRLLERTHPSELSAWTVTVFEDECQLAFAVPNQVGISSALLEAHEADDVPLLIVAHELAHLRYRHTSSRLMRAPSDANSTVGQIRGRNVCSTDLQTNDTQWAAASGSLGILAGITLPYSRMHEFEAWRLTADLLFESGVPMDRVLDGLEDVQQSGELASWRSVHPVGESEIDHFRTYINARGYALP